MRWIAVLWFPLLTCVCEPGHAREDVPGEALGAGQAGKVRELARWRGPMQKPLDQRHGAAPPALISYLVADNEKMGFAERPRAAAMDAAFIADVEAALRGLPAPVRRALDRKFAGVYFVEGLGSTGWTEALLDGKGNAKAGVIVLDYGVLQKLSANAWASWKENTPFMPDARYALQARIETPGEDTRRQAIQYILLHEIGHVLAVGTRLHPWNDVAPGKAPGRWPFMDLSWVVSPGGQYVSRFDHVFPTRASVVYYLGAKLEGARMEEAYTFLRGTSFVTLYGATNPFDDFAEAFASYAHTRLMGRPWEIVIAKDGREVLRYGACWEEERCAAKRRMVEAVLGIRKER
jgi:hypothetical protein